MAHMGIAIRRPDPAEIGLVGALTLEVYVGGGFIPADSDYTEELGDATTRAAEAELYVATTEPGDEVVGTVTFAAYGSPWAEVAGPGEGEFRMLAVREAARGRGVGQALVRHCLARARELGLAAVVLSSSPTMTGAHRVYERLGFGRTPEVDWSPVPGLLLRTYRLDL